MQLNKKVQIKNILIILRPEPVSEFNTFLPILSDWLIRRKKSVSFLCEEENRVRKIYKGHIKNISFLEDLKQENSIDLIITLGGDGTLIGACRKARKTKAPIFGINMGKLGFITEFSKSEFYDELSHVLEGKFETVKIPLYTASIFKQDKCLFKSYFVNDAVINKLDISRMFTLAIDVNDEHVYNLSGDGLIVSTPLGSTAYSLAAGGPIIHPQSGTTVITPICPHGLTHRPLVIPDSFSIKARLIDNLDHVNLTLDGQEALSISNEETFFVNHNPKDYLKMVKNINRTYFHTLKEKFTHGRRNN